MTVLTVERRSLVSGFKGQSAFADILSLFGYWEKRARAFQAEKHPFPNCSSMATRDDQRDVVGLGGSAEFLYACLNGA